MALVEGFRRDLGDALHRSGNGGPGGGDLVEGPEHPDVNLPVGVVLDHPDLLADDTLFLGHALLGEPGDGDEGQQNLQVLIEMVRGIKVVPGHGVGGKGVGLRAVFRQLLEGVALLGVEHLVLQVVGDTGGAQPLAVQGEAGVHASVTGGEKGIFLGVVRLGDHPDFQAVGQGFAVDGFAQALVQDGGHASASFPCKKYTVSSFTVSMAAKMRSGVTARTWSARSSGDSSRPVAAWPR